MPLPAALLAKLQKRGIVKDAPQSTQPKQDEEEVFAEAYDDPNEAAKPEPTITDVIATPPVTEDVDDDPIEADLIHEVTACPNKTNPYHECVDYCRIRWGMKAFEPDKVMIRRRTRMLDNYPLPQNWQEVADPQTSRYYYWNMQTDEVCWLSPLHPRATISFSAEKLSEIASRDLELDEEGNENAESTDESDAERSSEDDKSDDDKRRQKSRSLRERTRDNKRGKAKEADIDPMDPSSYSDVARGTWTSGLDQRGSAKTGVDHTVAGPLFQQRPYPSPGDILRANLAAAGGKDK